MSGTRRSAPGEGAGPAAVLQWVAARELGVGPVTLSLPPQLAAASNDGLVHVASLSDGRRCVLLKTAIGYKDNFEGVVRCSEPLQRDEVATAGAPPRRYVHLVGQGPFEELYLHDQLDDRTYAVYFDLN